jgi:four helix bundle protein
MSASAYKNFEELHVYQMAREMTNRVYAMTRTGGFSKDFGLRDQIRRAAVSVMSNIAEGFERGTRKEFAQFLYIAKGSCAEVRAQLSVALDQDYCSREDYDAMTDNCRRLCGMLANFIKHLRSTSSDPHRKL